MKQEDAAFLGSMALASNVMLSALLPELIRTGAIRPGQASEIADNAALGLEELRAKMPPEMAVVSDLAREHLAKLISLLPPGA